MKSLFWVFIGSGSGGVLRYLISRWALFLPYQNFPWGTLFVNVAASAMIGAFVGAFDKQLIGSEYRLLLMAGFCGGFSTFSAFSSETLNLWQSGQHILAAGYVIASVILCVGATYVSLQAFK